MKLHLKKIFYPLPTTENVCVDFHIQAVAPTTTRFSCPQYLLLGSKQRLSSQAAALAASGFCLHHLFEGQRSDWDQVVPEHQVALETTV